MSIRVSPNGIKQGMKELRARFGNKLRKERQVRLGHPADTALIYANDDKTRVFTHGLGDNPSDFDDMSASGIPQEKMIWGMSISIEQTDSGAWRYAAPHIEYDEQFSAGLQGNQPQQKIDIAQIDYGTVHPYSGLILFVRGAMYGTNWVDDQFTADFSTGTVKDTDNNNITIPTTNNKTKAVLIQVTPSTGALSYKQSSEFSSAISMVEAYKNDLLPTPDDSAYRLSYAKLTKGITAFGRSHLWTVPEFLNKGSASFPISLDYAMTIATNTQRVTGSFTIATGGSLTIDGRLTIV